MRADHYGSNCADTSHARKTLLLAVFEFHRHNRFHNSCPPTLTLPPHCQYCNPRFSCDACAAQVKLPGKDNGSGLAKLLSTN